MGKLLVLALFLVTVVVVVRWQKSKDIGFVDKAGRVSAIVIDKEERPIRPDHPNRIERFLHYSYMVDGREYTGQDKVEFSDLWLDIKKGQEIEVLFSKDNPGKSHPAMLMKRRTGEGDL